MAEIILAKHRNGAVCDVNLRFLKDQARFADMDDAGSMPMPASQQYEDFSSESNNALGSMVNNEFDPGRPVTTSPVKLDEEAPF